MAAAHLRVLILGAPAVGAGGPADATGRFRPGRAGAGAPQQVLERDSRDRETDPKRLEQRRKQIALGKATPGYQRYLRLVPKARRRFDGKVPLDPMTPRVHQKCSKRSWDGQVRKWRRLLHQYDPPDAAAEPGPAAGAKRGRDAGAAGAAGAGGPPPAAERDWLAFECEDGPGAPAGKRAKIQIYDGDGDGLD